MGRGPTEGGLGAASVYSIAIAASLPNDLEDRLVSLYQVGSDLFFFGGGGV